MDSSAAPPGLSVVSVLSLLACSIQVLAAVLLTQRYGGRSTVMERWILLWLFYDVIVHLTLVGGVCFPLGLIMWTLRFTLSFSLNFLIQPELPVNTCTGILTGPTTSHQSNLIWFKFSHSWLNFFCGKPARKKQNVCCFWAVYSHSVW